MQVKQLPTVKTIYKPFKYNRMCNNRSNNLDHSNHVRFLAGKMKRFGSLKDKAWLLRDKHYKILARSLGCAENSNIICYE